MVRRIVLTGGPCGGKTTAINKIRENFEQKGYVVLNINETATEIINMGIRPFGDNSIDMYKLQEYVFCEQLNKENLIEKYISDNFDKNIIVLYDRCILDNKSYVTEEQFYNLLNMFDINIDEYIKSHDLYIHMVSAAIGTNQYTVSNNIARVENEKEAKEKDDRVLECYKNVENHVVIDNSTDFDEKLDKVIKLIESIL